MRTTSGNHRLYLPWLGRNCNRNRDTVPSRRFHYRDGGYHALRCLGSQGIYRHIRSKRWYGRAEHQDGHLWGNLTAHSPKRSEQAIGSAVGIIAFYCFKYIHCIILSGNKKGTRRFLKENGKCLLEIHILFFVLRRFLLRLFLLFLREPNIFGFCRFSKKEKSETIILIMNTKVLS